MSDLDWRAKKLARLSTEIKPSRIHVKSGDVWKLGRHTLICARLSNSWQLWVPYLKSELDYFAPYPGPLVVGSLEADKFNLVMVQPDTYICGHIIQVFEDLTGITAVKQ